METYNLTTYENLKNFLKQDPSHQLIIEFNAKHFQTINDIDFFYRSCEMLHRELKPALKNKFEDNYQLTFLYFYLKEYNPNYGCNINISQYIYQIIYEQNIPPLNALYMIYNLLEIIYRYKLYTDQLNTIECLMKDLLQKIISYDRYEYNYYCIILSILNEKSGFNKIISDINAFRDSINERYSLRKYLLVKISLVEWNLQKRKLNHNCGVFKKLEKIIMDNIKKSHDLCHKLIFELLDIFKENLKLNEYCKLYKNYLENRNLQDNFKTEFEKHQKIYNFLTEGSICGNNQQIPKMVDLSEERLKKRIIELINPKEPNKSLYELIKDLTSHSFDTQNNIFFVERFFCLMMLCLMYLYNVIMDEDWRTNEVKKARQSSKEIIEIFCDKINELDQFEMFKNEFIKELFFHIIIVNVEDDLLKVEYINYFWVQRPARCEYYKLTHTNN